MKIFILLLLIVSQFNAKSCESAQNIQSVCGKLTAYRHFYGNSTFHFYDNVCYNVNGPWTPVIGFDFYPDNNNYPDRFNCRIVKSNELNAEEKKVSFFSVAPSTFLVETDFEYSGNCTFIKNKCTANVVITEDDTYFIEFREN